jgi:hypothetical protein
MADDDQLDVERDRLRLESGDRKQRKGIVDFDLRRAALECSLEFIPDERLRQSVQEI